MLIAVIALVVIPWINGAKPPEHYCAISNDHTMCLYRKFNSMGLRCRHFHAMPTNGVKRIMLRKHNSLRNSYAFQSKQQFAVPNMLGLEWDEELAEIAARWAMQCPYYEDDFRDVDRFKVVNMVGIKSHESSYSNLLEVWSSLVEGNVTFHKIPDGPPGRYRQLESAFKLDQPLTLITNPYFKYVGCAAAIYRQFVVEDEIFRTTLVCNYGPLTAPYDKYQPAGLPCTRCPNETYCHKNSSYPNLCFESISSSLSQGEQIPDRSMELRDKVYDDDVDEDEATTLDPGLYYNNMSDIYERGAENVTNPYCNIICDNGAVHTLCTYQDTKSPDYLEVVSLLGKPSKEYMVTMHNGIRDDLAGTKPVLDPGETLPLAANMREMSWSDELERAAVAWSMQCKAEKDDCRDIYMDGNPLPTYVSQLMYVSNWSGMGVFPSVTDAFYEWMLGMPFFSRENLLPYTEPLEHSGDYSAFAQVIWADTYLIGCGMTLCRQNNESVSKVVTACNYAPGGMVPGKSVFRIGGPCSDCKKLTWNSNRGGFCSMEYKSLCSVRIVGGSLLSLSSLSPVHSLASIPANDGSTERIIPPNDGATATNRAQRFILTSTRNPLCAYKCFDEARTHTMCKYKGPSANCRSLLRHSGGLAEDMVKLHNDIRDSIASGWYTDTTPAQLRELPFPQASNMREMIWNEQLAETALRWATQCSLQADVCRDLQLHGDKKYVINKHEIPAQDLMRAHQLISWEEWDVRYDPPSARQFFYNWMNEVVNFTIENIPAYKRNSRNKYEHFSQTIWARTYMIGCAMVSWATENRRVRMMFLVCNYAPLGGQHRWPVYQIGGPCTGCDPLYAEGTDGMVCSRKKLSLCQTDFSLSMKMETDRRLLFLLMISQIIKALLQNYYYHFHSHFKHTQL